jgi:hypothetical protein
VPAAEIDILNRALALLGQGAIASADSPGENAAALRRHYPASRDAVLASYPWNSAIRRAALPALVELPAFGFERQFELPADCLRVLDTEGDLTLNVRWRREGRRILADAPAPLRIRYVARVEDVGLLDAPLAESIAAHLAFVVAYVVTGSSSMRSDMAAIYNRTVREARMADAQEQSQDETLAAETLLWARF